MGDDSSARGSMMALEIAPGTTRIGWIGTGVMGSSMCGHLLSAGYRATVYNRTRSKSKPLVDRGAGQHTEIVNQILIATNMIGVCEALLYGYRAGLDLNRVMQSVGSGAAGSWSLNNLGPRMIAGNFEPGFFVEHFLKDMGIALAEARRMRLALPGLALAEQLYRAVEAQGLGRKGTHALLLALASLSEVDWKKTSL